MLKVIHSSLIFSHSDARYGLFRILTQMATGLLFRFVKEHLSKVPNLSINKTMDNDTFTLIIDFLKSHAGLDYDFVDENKVRITQTIDGKSLEIDRLVVEQVLEREDSTGRPFLQVNFMTGSKILLTQELIGFKPIQLQGLNFEKIPNVVTTPDLLSIVEALSEFEGAEESEVRTLRMMFSSILEGGEAVGFNLSRERLWLSQVLFLSAAA